MISKTKNERSNAIIMFHLYFCYYFPFYSVCDKSCIMIVFFVVTKNVSFTLPLNRNSFLHSLLLLSFTFSFPSFCNSLYRTHFFLFSHLTFFRVLHFIHRMYIAFTFTRKIVSNRSVDHDPSEVPHMLFYIKTTLSHMERLKEGTSTAIII